MKSFSRGILAAVAIMGIAWLAIPAASAQSVGPKVSTKVGHTVIRSVGSGATFAISSCTSASSSTVGCDIWQTSAIKPRNSVRLWCLAPTSGTSVTVAYKSNSPSGPIPSTVLTVKCKAPSVTKIATPSSTVVDPIVGRAPFSVVSCSTGDVFGTSCSNNGNNVRLTCRLDAYADTLPVTATATVTVEGASAIDDQQISFPFECM